MKRFTKTLLITVLAIALLAGCAGKKQKKAPVTPPVEETTVTVADAKKNIESVVKVSNYIVAENEDGTTSYSFRSDLFTDYDLNYTVSLGADTRINLPYSFPIMRSLGWEPSTSLTLKPKASTNVICSNAGKEIMAYLYNSTEEDINCANGMVTRIRFDLYSKDDNYKEALAAAPDFKFGNSIDNTTDINGIIRAIGEPSKITYGIDGDNCTEITLMYQNTENRDWLKFVLSPDGKKIVSVDYSVD